MSLVTMNEMLAKARHEKYAVGAFDACNYEMIRAVIDTAEELNAPVILSALKPDLEGKGLGYFASMAMDAARSARVPVCVHLDHAVELELIRKVIDVGFTSVMLDGSRLPFSQNTSSTKEACAYAHRFGVTVEGELGHVTDAIMGNEAALVKDIVENPCHSLTQPEEVEKFIEITGVDALAVAIGTAHGVYTAKPVLDFDLLKRLNDISSVPLVLHGGSGTPDEDICRVIELGICKVNIFSEVLCAFFSSLKATLNGLDNMSAWPCIVYEKPILAMKKMIGRKIILFGSAGKA